MNDWKEKLKSIKIDDISSIDDNLKWIDTHSHYNSRQFNKNQEELINEMRKSLEYIITLGTDVKTNLETIGLINKYNYLYGMVGFFPNEVYQIDESLNPNGAKNLEEFKNQLVNNKKIIGVGEIGMDYHWDSVGPKGKEIKGIEAHEIQERWFRYQLNLAKNLNLPVSMHSRDAEEDTLKIFEDFDSIKGVMHCFSYGMDSLKTYLDKGLYIGVGGTVTYPRNDKLVEAIKYCPIERILLETDAPYLSPQKVRRSINDSRNIKYVIEFLSDLKGISEEDIINITNKNAKELFNFS